MISPSGSRHWFKGINSATYDASGIFSSKKLRNIVKSRWQMENLKKDMYIARRAGRKAGAGRDRQRSSYKGRKENALALGADERRGKLR